MVSRNRPSLQQGLDRDVYQVVRKYVDDKNESPLKLRVSTVYEYLQRSNSSLKRRPKKQLEESIERVIDVMREDESSGEDEMAGFEGDLIGESKEDSKGQDKEVDWMNRQIVNRWAGVPATNGDKTKKRDAAKTNGERESKRLKKAESKTPKIDTTPPTGLTLEDLGGVGKVVDQLKEHLALTLLQPEEYASREIPIPRGILLHGPPGCGKTAICRAAAAELEVPFIEILGPSVVSGMSGESEKQIREIFDKAKEVGPCLIFIDEIDVIAPKRDNAQSQMEKRIVAQLLVSMDSLSMERNDGKPVIVLAATNRPDSIDPALRRGGRFDTEINMGVPNEPMREMILKALTRKPRLSEDVDLPTLAKRTAGFVGADLKDLVSKAGTWSMDRYREALEKQAAETEVEMEVDDETNKKPLDGSVRSFRRLVKRLRDKEAQRPPGYEDTAITMEAFTAVLPTIVPSSKREGFATVPDTTWEDVGALKGIREELEMAITEPIKNPERFAKVGITSATGVLLWGPPGCGKTLLAKAVAAESKANFISVNGPELLNKYVGESERAIRQVFTRARASVPCVIFFDEFDALAPKRSTEMHEASARVVNTLLTELDGLGMRAGIYLIAATNRPEMIDEAMLRPGRLERRLYIPLPEPIERVDILKALIRQKGVIDPSLSEFAQRDVCENFSGADLQALLRRSGQCALKRRSDVVEEVDLVEAATTISPSVGDIVKYEKMRKRFETSLRQVTNETLATASPLIAKAKAETAADPERTPVTAVLPNSTQHNGCGHIGEAHTQPWTLCDAALHRLSDLRGPNFPALASPPPDVAPPKRSSSTRRFLSLSNTLSRSATTSSIPSRRSMTGPRRPSRVTAPTSDPSALDYTTLPDHQLLAVRCTVPTQRTRVCRDMDVCKECKRWIVDMQHMVARYEKTGSIKGTSAFEQFLNDRSEAGGAVSLRGGASCELARGRLDGDVTVPLRDSVMGLDIGARQAIVLGYPEDEFQRGFWRGRGRSGGEC